jgi:hypothetical protein
MGPMMVETIRTALLSISGGLLQAPGLRVDSAVIHVVPALNTVAAFSLRLACRYNREC